MMSGRVTRRSYAAARAGAKERTYIKGPTWLDG
jgi:hypothetical protein